jgi:hypothetical protein
MQPTRRPARATSSLQPLRVYLLFVVVLVCCYLAATTLVTVPLVWPLGTTLVSGVAVRKLVRQRLARSRIGDRADRPPHLTTPTRRTSAVHPPAARRLRPAFDDDDRRVGDFQRDLVTTELHDAFAGGYLNQAELEERLDEVLAARTAADLTRALRELPPDLPQENRHA